MAERWENEAGAPLVVFYESGPYLLPDREQPYPVVAGAAELRPQRCLDGARHDYLDRGDLSQVSVHLAVRVAADFPAATTAAPWRASRLR